jgi:hypothetical protein
MKYIFYAFLAYLLYQLIFNLVIPVYKTTRKIKKGFREMNEKMNEQYPQQQNPTTADQTKANNAPAEDYIDFEEVK